VETIILRNLGPRDITPDQFDDRRPMRIDVGCEIASVLRFEGLCQPVIDVTVVEIPPCRLREGQSATLTLLVDGYPRERLDVADYPSDTRLSFGASQGKWRRLLLPSVGTMGLLYLIAGVAALGGSGPGLSDGNTPGAYLAGSLITGGLILVAAVATFTLLIHRKGRQRSTREAENSD